MFKCTVEMSSKKLSKFAFRFEFEVFYGMFTVQCSVSILIANLKLPKNFGKTVEEQNGEFLPRKLKLKTHK